MTTVRHSGAHRFDASLDEHAGRLDYAVEGDVLTILHTEVDAALQGRGVAGALVQAALDHARAEGLKVRPRCSYAASYMERHPESMSMRV